MHADADRQRRLDLTHAGLQRLAELQQVAAGGHGDAEPDGGLPIHPEQGVGRIGVATRDGGDITQAEKSVVDPQVDRAEVVLGRELAADAHRDPLGSGLDHARRLHRILVLQRLDERLHVQAEARQLSRGEIEVDHLVLGADDLHLADAGHAQDLGAHLLHVVAQLALAESVGGEAVDVAVDVAEFVVERGRLHARRQCVLDVLNVLADLVEELRISFALVVSLRLTRIVVWPGSCRSACSRARRSASAPSRCAR